MKRGCFWRLAYLLGLIMIVTGCADLLTTEEGATHDFNQLPFADSELVTLKIHQNSGNSCFSILVYAIYYDTRSFTEVSAAAEVTLLA